MTLNRSRHLLLSGLILLSLFFSYSIWAPNEEGDVVSKDQTTNQLSTALNERPRNQVYAPQQYVIHAEQSEIWSRAKMADIFELLMDKLMLETISAPEPLFRETFLNINQLSSNRYVEMIFGKAVPVGIFETNFDNLPSDIANQYFTRMAIDIDNLTTVYFYNDETEQIYEASIIDTDLTVIRSLFDRDDIPRTPVFSQTIKDNIIYLPERSTEISPLNYITERLPNSLFVSAFFPNTSNVEVRVSDQDTRYIDLTTEIRINQETNNLTYLKQLLDLNELTNVDRFNSSFHQVSNLENWTESILFDHYDENNKIITYRRYIEDYPIFDTNEHKSYIEVGVREDGLAHLQMPLDIIQTPITLEDDPVIELLSGVDLIQSIVNTGKYDVKAIEDLQIGLTWTVSAESDRVIHFYPEWYVKYDGQWLKLSEMVVERQDNIHYGL